MIIHVLICVNMYLNNSTTYLPWYLFGPLKINAILSFIRFITLIGIIEGLNENASLFFSNQTHCIVSIQLSRHSVTLLIGHIDLIDSKLRCCKGAAHGRKLLGMNAPSCITYL